MNFSSAADTSASSNISDELDRFANKSSVFSLSKIYCYSSASGINNTEGKAMWDVNVSQYTDIALGLSINNVNNDLTNNLGNSNLQVVDTSPKYSISKIYIDYGTNGTTSCTGIITKSKYVQ